MDVSLKFPSDAEVIAEEAARFRALSPAERMRVIRDLLNAGSLIMRQSPNAEFMRAYSAEQEELAQKAVKEFIARHIPNQAL